MGFVTLLCHGQNIFPSFIHLLVKYAPSCEHVVGHIFFLLSSSVIKKLKIPKFYPILSPCLQDNKEDFLILISDFTFLSR